MTDEQAAELEAAVDRVNAAIAAIKETDGDATRVRPGTRYSDDSGLGEVYVEVTTGLRRFPSHRP